MKNCIVCSNENLKKKKLPNPKNWPSFRKSIINICTECEFAFVSNFNGKLSNFYSHEYYDSKKDFELPRKSFLFYLSSLKRLFFKPSHLHIIIKRNLFKNYDKILEIGAGQATLLNEIKKSNPLKKINYFILEHESTFDNYYKQMNFRSIKNIKNKKFDYILSEHLFEHLENPLGDLKTYYQCLRKGGKIIFIIPNSYKDKNYFAPHLTYWNKHNISLCLKKFFKNLFVDTLGASEEEYKLNSYNKILYGNRLRGDDLGRKIYVEIIKK